MTTRSAIVLGAGSIGLSSAYYLRKSGVDVTVIDPEPLAARASGHNAGWLIPSMSTPVPAPGVLPQALKWMTRKDSPLYVSPSADPHFLGFLLRMLRHCTDSKFARGAETLARLSAGSLPLFDDLTADGVDFERHRDPLTMLFTDEHKVDTRVHELETLDGKLPGFSWRHMDRDELRAHSPSLSDDVVAGIQSEGDQSVDPASFVRGLAAACERDGVDLRLGETAALVAGPAAPGRGHHGIEVSVQVGGQRLRADHIVVAAGTWTNELLAGIGERIALQAGKGYGYDLPVVADGPTRPVYLAEAKVAITPLDNRVRLAGTMGFSGIDESIDPVRAGGILSGTRGYFTDWIQRAEKAHCEQTGGSVTPWTGLRPTTPDGVPMIGPLARHPEVLVATGHVMLGISLGPTTGRLIAELATGETAPESLPDLSPNRF
jgi:D-amino-acid dehydrogenase